MGPAQILLSTTPRVADREGQAPARNDTRIVAKSNVVHEIRSAFKYDGRKGEIFCDETQAIPLEFQCAKPIVTVIARSANGEVVVDSTNESHDQYDTIFKCKLEAVEQRGESRIVSREVVYDHNKPNRPRQQHALDQAAPARAVKQENACRAADVIELLSQDS